MANNVKALHGRIAVVTGASRGAGRAIAAELGAAGATVYVTGRTRRGAATPAYAKMLSLAEATAANATALPGSIDETADEVTRAGGQGIAVPCDHTVEAEVAALFERVKQDHKRLDVLVNNAWGGHESFDGVFQAPFWEHSLDHWESMFDKGVRNHLLASRHAVPLMLGQRGGLLATTTFWDRGHYLKGNLFYDLAKASMTRLAFGMAEELRPHGIASVAVSPGWMRTEIVLAGHRSDEAHWHEEPSLARTESPHYLGRAIVALANDPDVMKKSGGVHLVADLAQEYGFTDIDGRKVEAFRMDG